MDPLPSVEAIAETYNTPGYADPMDAIADFREYQRNWASADLGSHAISTRMEIPRGRIRTWEDGGRPDVVRGVETARENQWLEQSVDSESFAALNRLVAGVFSGGSISVDTFEPSFSAPDAFVEDQLRDDLETLGAGTRVAMSNSGNVEELRPRSHASVLGRILVALGAPQGSKAQTVDQLPPYLSQSPDHIRRSFIRVYIANRAVDRRDRSFHQIQERRSDRYRDELVDLIEDVTDVDVWRDERTIRFRDDALSVLDIA